MPKQIKLGFDKVAGPSVDVYEKLLDLNTGIELKNSDGGFLYTAEVSGLQQFTSAAKSTPVHVNNNDKRPVKVVEQFPETSQVSSSLLGVPRAETQLSLFSDVSTYGLDGNIWEFFSYWGGPGYQPIEWTTRRNKIYGSRYYGRLDEVPNEQALAINAFPVPWSYPFGPKFEDVGAYNATLFTRYKNFIRLGNLLYDDYSARGYADFAKENFLSSEYVIPDSSDYDVVYNTTDYTIEDVFSEIEKWTLTWMKLRDGQLFSPTSQKIKFPDGFDASNTIPGYSSRSGFFAQMESKRTYRYQPGRISGFTFGIRASTDQGSKENIIEWGCGNDTDEYVFQLKGSEFNIVRRSVIPLPDENLYAMGLTPADQTVATVLNPLRSARLKSYAGEESVDDTLYELVIKRDFFNGDGLNALGRSGYLVTFENVTMWKIEFSWYGAIGAKFYAYIPVSNGDARWVLMHTLVIENQIGQPCLKDPFFKFKYMLAIQDTSSLTYPQYIYKYGASMYIDGGDEGTMTNQSYSSNLVSTIPGESRSIIGLTAKQFISNSAGDLNKNRKDIIPQKITVSSDSDVLISLIDCEGCGGFGHHYAPSLHNSLAAAGGPSGIVGTVIVNAAGDQIEFTPDNENIVIYFPEEGKYKKLIGDGLYSTYIDYLGNISRRVGDSAINNEIIPTADFSNTELVKLSTGQTVPIKGQTFTNVRLSGYDDIVAANTPLTKENIRINFLNPVASDSRHYAEFFIGITDKEPSIDIVSNELVFDNEPLDFKNLLYGEFAQYAASKDINGVDSGEGDPRYGYVFQIDPRIPNPSGVDSGRCSQVRVTVSQQNFNASYSPVNPVSGAAGNYLIFDSSVVTALNGLLGGEIGVLSGLGEYEASGVTFLADRVTTYQEPPPSTAIKYYIEISSEINLQNIDDNVAIKFASIAGRFISKSKVFTWNIFPLYVVVGMRDYARVNNVTIEEYNEISKFTYCPTWLKSSSCKISVVNSGTLNEVFSPSNGQLISGGLSAQGTPPTNFEEKYRLNSAQVDLQLQQPLRPGEVRSSFYVGANEAKEFDLSHVYGADRYTITPGLLNTKATFVLAKSLNDAGEVQITLMTKEQ